MCTYLTSLMLSTSPMMLLRLRALNMQQRMYCNACLLQCMTLTFFADINRIHLDAYVHKSKSYPIESLASFCSAAELSLGHIVPHRSKKGREAMGYFQFIIDYYDRLPASLVFMHGAR